MERKDEILETENKRLLRTEFIVYRNLVKKILGLENQSLKHKPSVGGCLNFD